MFSQPLGACSTAVTKKEMPIPLAIPIAMAGMSAISSIWGGKKSADAAKRAERQLADEKAKTEAERIRAKYQSWTDTASGQNTLRMLRDEAARAYKRTAGAAAVGGATDAAVAQEKELQNLKQAEVIAGATAAHEDKKDAIDASYRGQLQNLNQQQIEAQRAKSKAIADAAGGVASSLMQGAVSTFGGTKLGQSMMGGGGSPVDKTAFTRTQANNSIDWLRKNAVFQPRLQTM